MSSVATEWEDVFRMWSKPSSETEQQKAANAESMIRAAIRDCDRFKGKDIEIFAQGSYRNNTNVRRESDVDITVRCNDVCYADLSGVAGLRDTDVGLSDATYTYRELKNDVEAALKEKFGKDGVTRGSKAFDVHPTSYRVDADVVAVFQHRRYYRATDGRIYYHLGSEFWPDTGGSIINWPQQHHENGVEKNKATGNRFKYITRVLKRLRNHMADQGIAAAKPIPSYLIECLVWNVPNSHFGHDDYVTDVRDALAHLFNDTMLQERCKEWGEVNELKYLFGPAQPWTREKAFRFVDAAWDFLDFE